MEKETFTEKLIKRTYGISGPLDEHKRREADRIGNKVFMVLFYLMIFGNLIPFILAYKYPQVVAFGYPIIIFLVSMVCAIYVSTQTKKTGITAIDPDMLSQKESKQLRYPGIKAGLLYGVFMFFGIPLLNVLTDNSKNFFTSLFNLGHFISILFAAFFFGLVMQIIVWLRIRKAKEDQDDD
ncbi:DUF3278 domain-containing protein [Streptococcus parasanguinis]|uniref:DUF6773 family protein n=1 Tax=Streptococcus TaxID=1301 RepID=UPI0008A11E9F|nr:MULTISPECIES: DUF6773 family protein [Streptococcus]MDO6229560.1 DUF3278 domain-containing protein [Streptococcus parasanguinis]OFN94172.1 hypothetical protein HMPREF2686_05095 [Streptococcus sp. HMSC057G03]